LTESQVAELVHALTIGSGRPGRRGKTKQMLREGSESPRCLLSGRQELGAEISGIHEGPGQAILKQTVGAVCLDVFLLPGGIVPAGIRAKTVTLGPSKKTKLKRGSEKTCSRHHPFKKPQEKAFIRTLINFSGAQQPSQRKKKSFVYNSPMCLNLNFFGGQESMGPHGLRACPERGKKPGTLPLMASRASPDTQACERQKKTKNWSQAANFKGTHWEKGGRNGSKR